MKIKCVLVDDEPLAVKVLQNYFHYVVRPPDLSLRVRTRDAGIWDKEGIVNDRSDFQPFSSGSPLPWGFAPGWYKSGPLALI